ncbi:bonus isoform c-related [Anaeramoeba flamelloides]|uniref:Bonus isoform c-related n=1 Tax=Anaeramoeba flamelloides TaxID=1746091 RepID=A0AAV8A1E4_9EUKA|nr:bonus isoform c-related [Anaeramoeba flamelloides]
MNNPKNNNEKPKRRKKKKKQKRQDPQRFKDTQIPVEPPIPQCQVCEKQKANFYCTKCDVHYCQNCEPQVHTSSFLKKRHQEFIFQEPYNPFENSGYNRTEKCPIHQKNTLSRYSKNCKKLICSECVFDHTNLETIEFDQPMDFYKELINEQKKMHSESF